MDLIELAEHLVWPLTRLMIAISIGLFIANLVEALNWTRAMAKLASPLIRIGHLKDVVGASFSMAFFSGIAANTILAENYDKGHLTDKELILANLFNSLPTYFLHLPTMFFITVPFIGPAAFTYVSLTLCAAFLRTAFILLLGNRLLPPIDAGCVVCRLDEQKATSWQDALKKTWTRFKKRIKKVASFTIPIYIIIYFLNTHGVFKVIEEAASRHLDFLPWLSPQTISIIVFQMASEFTAGLAAAGALLDAGTLTNRDIIIALILGNVLSSPMRAFRHQFPYYAGIFKPGPALKLITCSQLMRTASLIVVGIIYFVVTK
ncbi:membrane protein [Desulfovibrio inopinatus]|uniref:membrane protein n=1 Tax=Desulfovibrio inopinatus TaxID=102109 RepID=UPI000402D0D9|nr:membrane protein [Desulfovibrio inopinatus]